MKRKSVTQPMMTIGTSVEAVKETRQAIVEILKLSGDRDVLVAALDAFKGAVEVKNTLVQNCTFTSESADEES